MIPILYLYKETNGGVELYFNALSTLNGLEAIDGSDQIKLIAVGATGFKNYGYATAKEFPVFNHASELIAFLHEVGDIGLIDFEIEIIGKGKMMSHDDGECHFLLNNKKDGMAILKKIAPASQSEFIIGTLLKNKGIYIAIDEENNIRKYASFKAYLAKH